MRHCATCLERLRPEALESFELTDVFQGPSIPADKVSFSMAFTYRAGDRTLTGDEVNGIHQELVKKMVEQIAFNPTIRSIAHEFKGF